MRCDARQVPVYYVLFTLSTSTHGPPRTAVVGGSLRLSTLAAIVAFGPPSLLTAREDVACADVACDDVAVVGSNILYRDFENEDRSVVALFTSGCVLTFGGTPRLP